jgi:folate-binding protein YgfZ
MTAPLTSRLTSPHTALEGCGVAPTGGEVVAVTGPDARSFLQSLVSQDIDGLQPGSGARSLLLQPQGKLTAAFRLLVIDPELIWCDTDAGVGGLLADALNRFRIRVKAEVAVIADLRVVALRGAAVDDKLGAAGGPARPAEPHAHVEWDDVRLVRADWGSTPGADLIGSADAVDALAARLVAAGAFVLDAEAYETARIEHGVLRQGVDIDDSTIPQEAELETETVSFTKGCFLGQELVCRIDTRGHVNRFVRRLDFAAGIVAPPAGSDVTAGDKSVGRITSAAPGSPVALAIVRREVELGATVEAAGEVAVVAAR